MPVRCRSKYGAGYECREVVEAEARECRVRTEGGTEWRIPSRAQSSRGTDRGMNSHPIVEVGGPSDASGSEHRGESEDKRSKGRIAAAVHMRDLCGIHHVRRNNWEDNS